MAHAALRSTHASRPFRHRFFRRAAASRWGGHREVVEPRLLLVLNSPTHLSETAGTHPPGPRRPTPGVRALREMLARQVSRAQRQPFDVLTLIVDDYAVLLASLGWRVAERLAREVRSLLDATACRVFQIAADRYAVVILHRGGRTLAEWAQSVRKVVADAQLGARCGADVTISVSIGMLTVDTRTRAGVDHLIDQVLALGLLLHGRGQYQLAVVEGDADLEARMATLRLVMRIRQAIEHDQLVLFAQPIRPLRASHPGPLRQEVLVRLREMDGTLRMPSEFLPIADRHGLAYDIDKWVVRNTFAWLGRQVRAGGRGVVNTSINLSGASVAEADLVDYVQHLLDEHLVDPGTVCFEITESVGIVGLEQAIRNITELRRRGLRFALDDFGSGMASLSYLRDLPLDYLKIDGSFIRDVVDNPANQYMVGVIHAMSRAFGLETIAEYAEDRATVDYLTRAGIDYAQGRALGMPAPLGGECRPCGGDEESP